MSDRPTRILALDPTTKGFGYVLLEEPFQLIEWRQVTVTGNKNKGALARFDKLLSRLRPDVVVLEDAKAPGSRRCARVRKLIHEELAPRAKERGFTVHLVARREVVTCFSRKGARTTKQVIATRLVQDFPDLAPKFPPSRKDMPWQSEKERMAIFDALALVVTHLTK